jgi:hypothetical protein
MVNDLVQTLKTETIFNGLDESLKIRKLEKSVKQNLLKSIPAVGATAAPVGRNELQILLLLTLKEKSFLLRRV